MSVSFCLPHPVAVSAFMICRGLCACTEMCVLYVIFGSGKTQNLWDALPWVVLCCLLFVTFCRRVWCEQSASCFVWI